MIYDIGAECGFDYSFYLVCGKSNFLIDGTSEMQGEQAISAIEKHIPVSEIEAMVFTGTTPDKTGFLKLLLDKNKDIKVFASVTGLRNIKEILNHDNYCGFICKHGEHINLSGADLEIFITPNLPNPDNIVVYYEEEKALFSGYVFSEKPTLSDFYCDALAGYSAFAENVMSVIKNRQVDVICRTYGGATEGVKDIFDTYNSLLGDKEKRQVLVAYSSVTGNNKKIAYKVADVLKRENVDASVICLDECTPEIYDYKGLILVTYTKYRNMPDSVWKFIKNIDVSRAKEIPYFVFGSCGWSCEGPYIASENLSLLKLKKVCKVQTCIFTPDDEDMEVVEKNTKLLVKTLMEKTNA